LHDVSSMTRDHASDRYAHAPAARHARDPVAAPVPGRTTRAALLDAAVAPDAAHEASVPGRTTRSERLAPAPAGGMSDDARRDPLQTLVRQLRRQVVACARAAGAAERAAALAAIDIAVEVAFRQVPAEAQAQLRADVHRALDGEVLDGLRGALAVAEGTAGQRSATLLGLDRTVTTSADRAAVQRAPAAARGTDPAGAHAIAGDGVRGASSRLPFHDRLQRAFGRHDLGGVVAQIGGAARDASHAMDAAAYAYGDRVAFAEAPDLHTAAHEAAHVVQQRAGVALPGGVGAAGDAHERHADAVADAVVRGASAEALLDGRGLPPTGSAAEWRRGSIDRTAGGTGTGADGPAVQHRPRTVYFTAPVPGPDGTATEAVDHAGLATASFEQLCQAYAMAAPADPEAPVAIGRAQLSYTWIRSRVGTVVLRGELRAALLRDGAAGIDAHAATVAAVTGDAARHAELAALVAEVRAGHPALLDEHRGIATFATRTGTSHATAEDVAAVAGRPHHASDITAHAGTGVYAPLAGEVIFSGGVPGYGNLVRLLHRTPPRTRSAGSAPVETVYAHLCERLVAVGASVAAGQAIGMVGRTTGDEDPDHDGEGFSGTVRPSTAASAAHLHMAVILQSDAPDPARYATPIETRSEIRPDRWLGELGVSISADPVLHMTRAEADAAQADAVAGGGSRETHRETREVPDAADVVHRSAAGTPAATGRDAVAIARRAVDKVASAAPLPFARELQASFGRHDVSAVRAHVGGDAARAAGAIGARAYAIGNDVAFASAPDLHLAAHEAAHVVQQRAGVHLAGGVGSEGDSYEQHADAVADAVVRGQPAEPLLDALAHGGGGEAVQRDPEDDAGDAIVTDTQITLPEGVTPAQVEAAVRFNDELELRIDWVRRLQHHVRADGAMTSVDGRFDRDTIAGVMRIQATAGQTIDGRITPAMRRLLEQLYPELRATLLGPHLDGRRELVPTNATAADRYTYYRGIITQAGGVFVDHPREVNLLGIRGVELIGAAPNLGVWQSGSAAALATARTEDDAALGDGSAGGDPLHADDAHPPEHFSGRAGYDDVIVSIWFALDGAAPTYHVTEHRGSVDPATAWSESGANDHPDTQGTAHLRDGQYLYHLGMHSAGSPAHAHAVYDRYHGAAHSPVALDGTRDDLDYSALRPSRGVEIWRDRPGHADDDHYPTAAEEAESDDRVTEHADAYTSRGIGIDLHSSPAAGPSSVGCQTVPVDADYDDLIGEVRDSADPRRVYYTLIDASRIEAGLVLESSAPFSAGAAPAPTTTCE
jgi:Domain of unknown function (DUF4157)/Peptidase family M23